MRHETIVKAGPRAARLSLEVEILDHWPGELVLRVRYPMAVTPIPAMTIKIGALTIARDTCQAWSGGRMLRLTPMEFLLLITLVERRGRVQTRERLLSDVWGYRQGLETRTVDTHVRRLREKLGAAGRLIETVRGFGYVARVTSGRGDSR